MFDELPPLGGLPQQVPEVVRVLLRLAAGGQRPGDGAAQNLPLIQIIPSTLRPILSNPASS